MRYLLLTSVLIFSCLTGCTTKITRSELNALTLQADQQELSSAARSADAPTDIQLWYMGSRLGYNYYHFQYVHGEKKRSADKSYRITEANDTNFQVAGRTSFHYTKDRTKWVLIAPLSAETLPPKPAAPPAARPAGVTLDDLHT